MAPLLKTSEFYGSLCASVSKYALCGQPSFYAQAQIPSGENQVN
jgi:hypothetical protein